MKLLILPLCILFSGCVRPDYDVVIRSGWIYDGSGSAPFRGDVAIRADRIAKVGEVSGKGAAEINANGLAVAPGFINVLSWATESLIADGRAQSDVRQGVTTEIFGEGESMGPLNAALRSEMLARQGDIRYEPSWNSLREYLEHLEKKGVAVNVASFIGAETVRKYVIGSHDRAPTAEELSRMRSLVDVAMRDGALGVGSSLIYAPGFYAKTDELVALCEVAARHGGMYISHLRSEGNAFLEALDEFLTIARSANIPAEIYHLKAAGERNWPKLAQAIAKVEAARAEGLRITADMYTYTAGATGLDAAMPPWVQEGGYEAWRKRLLDPAIRAKVRREMRTPTNLWENLYLGAGKPENVLLVGFKNPALKPLTGRNVAEVARLRGKSPEDTIMDLVIEDGSRVGTVYFLMSEENVRRQLRLPWVSFGSDAGAPSAEGVFLKTNPHPRAYGTFARLLGRYVRDEKILPLEEAVRRLTGFPASNLKLEARGLLKEGNFADVVVFDPASVRDHATFDKPHQYATGVLHVWVNGKAVLEHSKPTGTMPGRALRRRS